MTLSNSQAASYLVKLVDTTHQVEMGLYPKPTDEAGVRNTLAELQKFPHTEGESASIINLLSIGANELLSKEDYQELFPDREAVAGEGVFTELDPVEIALTNENYGLVYTAVQTCLEQLEKPAAEPVKVEVPQELTEKLDELVTQVKSLNANDTNTSFAAVLTEKIDKAIELMKSGLVTANEASEVTDKEEATEDTTTLTAEVTALKEELMALREEVVEQAAGTAALYWQLLKKPQARDKTHEQLVETLTGRGKDALAYLLEDLRAEFAAAPPAARTTLPLVDDPTLPAQTEDAEDINAPVINQENAKDDTFVAGELPMEEEDTIFLLFPGLRA